MNHIVISKANPDFRVQLAQFYGGSPQEQIGLLKERFDQGGAEDKVLFALGKLQKRVGQFSEALGYYEKLPESSQLWPLAQINIGNIYFSGHEYQNATSAYETALRAQPNMGVALYNLSVTLGQLGNHREAEQKLREAK